MINSEGLHRPFSWQVSPKRRKSLLKFTGCSAAFLPDWPAGAGRRREFFARAAENEFYLEDLVQVLTTTGNRPEFRCLWCRRCRFDRKLTVATCAAGELCVFRALTFIVVGDMVFGNDRLQFLREHLEK
jgi:hypothetical protein